MDTASTIFTNLPYFACGAMSLRAVAVITQQQRLRKRDQRDQETLHRLMAKSGDNSTELRLFISLMKSRDEPPDPFRLR
jgi:hypothetical protein